MEAHFVTFYSPGTFVSENTTQPIDSWDTAEAMRRARSVKERYGATPYGFRFTTRTRGPEDLDSHESARSGLYWLGGKVESLADVKARATPNDAILICNMEGNRSDFIVTNTNSWSWTMPLGPDDHVLEWKA